MSKILTTMRVRQVLWTKGISAYHYCNGIRSHPSRQLFSSKLPTFLGRRFFSRSWQPKKQPVTWYSVGALAIIGFGWIYFVNLRRKDRLESLNLHQEKYVGKAAIGGPFELVDCDGKVVSDKTLLGKWALLYFGFTHCPDVCPDELEKLSTAIEVVDKEKPPNREFIPIFVTVDPQRDTPEVIKDYIKEFSPRFIGLTGTDEQIKKAAKAYRIYYSAGPKDVDNDYIVDHSIISYLVNPVGEFVDYYGQNRTDKQIATNILLHMTHFENKVEKGLVDTKKL